MRPTLLLPLALALTLAPLPAAAELSLGLTGGLVLPGEQDVTLTRVGPGGERLAVERPGRDTRSGPLGGLTATWWPSADSAWGLQLDALGWTTTVTLSDPPAGAPTRIRQSRAALLLSLLARLRLGAPDGAFAYGGLGGGLVATRLDPGASELGPGVGLLGGLAVPLTDRLRVRLEARYLLTSDVDAARRPGWGAETSGTATPLSGRALFGPHLDTRFLPLLLGLDWVW